ncbi:MAG: NFACT RNA binding domain-containing protein [Clostridiales bacterium]|nr:NFACT RNA binding domain-containing protein [Clostridiales bacterium]
MAFDGFFVASLTKELSEQLTGGHLQKISQPEKDELVLAVKNNRQTLRLVLSASPSLPLIYLTKKSKVAPLTAPNFCMLLRKHLSGARICRIYQYELERVLFIEFENRNELGDLVHRNLVIEIMGKHSNIIFLDEKNVIVDSIRHISSLVSSVREVLPGRPYFIPNTREKHNPFELTTEQWIQELTKQPASIVKGLCNYLTGFSFSMAQELAYRCQLDGDAPLASCNGNQLSALLSGLRDLMEKVKQGDFSPEIVFRDAEPIEFSAFEMKRYGEEMFRHQSFDSVSEMIEVFYGEKEAIQRIRQKSADLRKNIMTLLERDQKKIAIQRKQLKDTEKRERYKIYGEHINTYGYQLGPEDTVLKCTSYYDESPLEIPIDPAKTPTENANKYFERYNKLKRTYEAVSVQIEETQVQIDHLETILTALDIARQEEDLQLIKQELVDSGYMKGHIHKKNKNTKAMPKSKPLHFRSSDGFDMFVGKNNYQNDMLTFKMATGNDWWFHVKQAPGSHVIVQCNNEEPPIRTFEEAASLAAHFSQKSSADKVEIDYTQKKNVKKPNGSKPGFVVYYTNYSMVVSPDISEIEEIC